MILFIYYTFPSGRNVSPPKEKYVLVNITMECQIPKSIHPMNVCAHTYEAETKKKVFSSSKIEYIDAWLHMNA